MSKFVKWLIIHSYYLIKKDLHSLAYDPDVQFKFHLCFACFWTLCFATSYWWPPFGAKHIGEWLIFQVSLYANADTDYDAMSASLAAKYAKKAHEGVNVNQETPDSQVGKSTATL